MASGTQSYDIGSESDTGRRRSENQDAYGRADSGPHAPPRDLRERYGRLFVVADGVGGNDDGKEASELVVARVMAHFYAGQHPSDAPHQGLRQAIERANADLRQEAGSRNSNMASTVVAALIAGNTLIIANVGDSVALLLREGQAPQQLSESHVTTIAGRSMLSQAMGHPEIAITFHTSELLPRDIVVLASDGLTNQVGLEQIQSVCRRFDSRTAAKELVRLANERGGPDNITALVIGNRPRPAHRHPGTWLLVIAVLALSALIAAWVGARLITPTPMATSLPTAVPTVPPATPGTAATANPSDPTPTLAPVPSATPTSTPTNTPTATPTFPPPPPTRTPPPLTPTLLGTDSTTTEIATVAPEVTPMGTTPPPAARSFRAQLARTFPDSGSSGVGQSCISGRVRDRNDDGVSGAVVYVNNGALSITAQPTDQNGRYEICALGYSDWSVVLTYIPGPPDLAGQVIGRTFLSGSPDQRAIIDFVEQ